MKRNDGPAGRLCRFTAAALMAALIAAVSGCISKTSLDSGAVLPGEPVLTVYAAGDIADCRRQPPLNSAAAYTAQLLADQIARHPEALVITLGDNVYRDGTPEEFLYCYEPTWGRFKSRTLPSPGNHDYHTPGAAGYFAYFGASAGPIQRGYYSITVGNWHLISLNSNLEAAHQQEQMEWLRKELAQHGKPCTLAFWHHPVFSSGRHGNSSRMREAWEVLAAAGAEVVLTAHDHHYERFMPQNAHGQIDWTSGVRQFVVGTGGANLRPLRWRKLHSETGSDEAHGVLKLVLKPAGYEWEFLATTTEAFIDRGVALCR